MPVQPLSGLASERRKANARKANAAEKRAFITKVRRQRTRRMGNRLLQGVWCDESDGLREVKEESKEDVVV